MTNRDRVLTALIFEKPDYTPHCVAFTWQMYQKMIAHTGNPHYYATLNNHIASVDVGKPEKEIRPLFFEDEFGVVWNKSGADRDIGVVDFYQLKETEDLNSFQLPPVDEAHIREQMETLMRDKGDNFSMASIGFSMFERAWTLRGMENLLCDMITEPEFVEELLEKITRRILKILDIMLEYDVDSIYFGDDWGQQKGLIMGRPHWVRFIKPCMARLYGRVHQAGKYVAQHSCGDIRDIMDDLHEIGLNMYNTFQPEIYGYDYAKKIHGKISIWGGISTQRDLPYKTPDEIRAVTRELLAAFPHGGLVAAPTHAVPGDVPPENILAMMDVLQGQK